MYNVRPGILIGFHGCDKSRQQRLLTDHTTIPVSKEPFDWLGHGMYFWENNYVRAFQWAKEKEAKGKINEAAVIGAVLDLSYCCDLADSKFIENQKFTILAYAKDNIPPRYCVSNINS
jgi:hypothetical protein